MNSNFVIFVLVLIIIILYYSKQTQSIQSYNKVKTGPYKFNPAIHHPAML